MGEILAVWRGGESGVTRGIGWTPHPSHHRFVKLVETPSEANDSFCSKLHDVSNKQSIAWCWERRGCSSDDRIAGILSLNFRPRQVPQENGNLRTTAPSTSFNPKPSIKYLLAGQSE
jgi:hypothetical protein